MSIALTVNSLGGWTDLGGGSYQSTEESTSFIDLIFDLSRALTPGNDYRIEFDLVGSQGALVALPNSPAQGIALFIEPAVSQAIAHEFTANFASERFQFRSRDVGSGGNHTVNNIVITDLSAPPPNNAMRSHQQLLVPAGK